MNSQGFYYQAKAARKLGLAGQLVNDAVLVGACLANKDFAWDALIEKYQALIYSCALSCGLRDAEAGDVFQVVCLALYDNLHQVRDTAKLASWLIATTKREAWRAAKRRGNTASIDDDLCASAIASTRPGDDPEKSLLADEQCYAVHLGLSQLGSKCQRLLGMLYAPEKISYGEIADQMNIPLGSIGPTRARCLQNLKKAMNEMGY